MAPEQDLSVGRTAGDCLSLGAIILGGVGNFFGYLPTIATTVAAILAAAWYVHQFLKDRKRR